MIGWEHGKSCIVKKGNKEPAYEPKVYVDEPEYKPEVYEPEYKPEVYEPEYEPEAKYKIGEPEYIPSYHAEPKHGGDKKDYKSGHCAKEIAYFKSTNSATLKQCIFIACAPGQTWEYKERAIYQCHALEKAARANNHGHLPRNW
jgi:hypothetical protein